MNRKTAKVVAFILIIAMVITSFSIIAFVPGMIGFGGPTVVYGASKEDSQLNKDLEDLGNYLKIIQENYKDKVPMETLIKGAYRGAMESLEDPFSVYYDNPSQAESFQSSISGTYWGIGISGQGESNGEIRLTDVKKGGPAQRAGIKIGDVITSVDGVPSKGKNIEEVFSAIRGKSGTPVTVTIKRAGSGDLSFSMIREEIKSQSVYGEILDEKDKAQGKIGYIEIASFDDDGSVEFKQVYKDILSQGATSIIIDLRDNGGGLVDTALNIANQLTENKLLLMNLSKQGTVVRTVTSDGTGSSKLPLVVLVNHGTASASEILVASLQDNKLATIVGEKTYGKGIAQNVVELANGTSFKLSFYYFSRPNGSPIHQVGITPDHIVKDLKLEGREALAKEYSHLAPMSENKKPVFGETGLNVYGAQERLVLLGYKLGTTGYFDEAMKTAVADFQKSQGLYPYGVLDFTTMKKLDAQALAYVSGKEEKDYQLEKAISLLR